MIDQINGLHHVTSLASDPRDNNAFFTQVLGLRRIKKTVNFDRPDVYHLYYGDEVGTPGGVMTYFPFPGKERGSPGHGEVGKTVFSVPEGSLPEWQSRLQEQGVAELRSMSMFDQSQLLFGGPDGETLALAETVDDHRSIWNGGGISPDIALRGFHSVALSLEDIAATGELLSLMGYQEAGRDDGQVRYIQPNNNGAGVVDLVLSSGSRAREGAGSVHHVAFSVPDRAAQLAARTQLIDAGFDVTDVFDRSYFWAIYFRTPGGILFEIATDGPGFASDEDVDRLGEALKLPDQHAHLREQLKTTLPSLGD